jgi:hypothetical protein
VADRTQTLKDFAALLAAEDDPAARAGLIKRVNLLAAQEVTPEQLDAPISTLAEYLATEIPVPPVLVEPALVVRGGIACTIGRAGKGKTQMNLNRMMKWACGRPMFEGLFTADGTPILAPPDGKPLKTLIIENEGAPGMFHRQVGIMLNAEGYLTEEDRFLVEQNLLIWGDGGYSGLKLDDESLLSLVRSGIEKHEPDIVFVEPFRGLWRGEENSATDMANVADALSGIATDYDCGVILTHHERKSGAGEDGEKMSAGRGSTVLEGVVATMENFEVAKGGDFRELSWSKVRYGGGHAILPVRMSWQHGAWWYKHVPLDAIEQGILTELAKSDEPLTVGDLILLTNEKEHTLRKTLKDLVESEKIVRMASVHTGNGSTGFRYRLNTGGGDDPEAPGVGGADF